MVRALPCLTNGPVMTTTSINATELGQFECAVIRLVSLQTERGQPGQLFFTSVTLLALCRQRPPSSVGVERFKIARTGKHLYFRRVVLGVNDALTWYRNLGSGFANLTPVPELESERDSGLDGISFEVPSLTDRPAWPRLGLSLGRDLMFFSDELANPCPFVGSVPSRVHRRFSSGMNLQGVFDDVDCIQRLKTWVHFDVSKYPEYAGSAVLVVPDPLVRRIDSFYVDNSAGGEDQVLRIVPQRPGGLSGLAVTLFERQAHQLSRFETHNVPADGIVVAPGNESLGATGFVLTHEKLGPLQASAASHYIRSISLNLDVEESAAVIEAPADGSNSPAVTTYQSTVFSDTRATTIGIASTRSIDVRLEESASIRRQAFEASHYEQSWLKANDREAALQFVRTRVHRARKSVLVADPYLGFRQLRQFLFAISQPGVKVTLLTSRLAFESEYAEDPVDAASLSIPQDGSPPPPPSREDEFARFEELRKEVASLKRHTRGDVEVWVLPGDKPELHDRFLSVDGTVWIFGGSFNGLGERASLVIRLPQPRDILEQVHGMISRARSLDSHIAMRSVFPPAPSPAATLTKLDPLDPPQSLSWWRRKLLELLELLSGFISSDGADRRA